MRARHRIRRRRRRTATVLAAGAVIAGASLAYLTRDGTDLHTADRATTTEGTADDSNLAAGEVAAIPPDPELQLSSEIQPATISPIDATQILTEATDCLSRINPDGSWEPAGTIGEGSDDLVIERAEIDPNSGRPTIEITTTHDTVVVPGGLADQCSDTDGVDIGVTYNGPPIDFDEGNLAEPAFSGDGWQLTVGEGVNGDTGTFKVCHTFGPGEEGAPQDGGSVVSGCSDWPSANQPDVVIVHAQPGIVFDDRVVLFVDLGTVPVDRIIISQEDGSAVEVAPFVMPRSHKQFAVVELPAGPTDVTIDAVAGDGTILDTRDLSYVP